MTGPAATKTIPPARRDFILTYSNTITDFPLLKQKVLNWLKQFDTFCFLDNHQYQLYPHEQECLAGAGIKSRLLATPGAAMEQLQAFTAAHKNAWLFGHLSYDLKNELTPGLGSGHPDSIGFADLFFFEPEVVIRLNEQQLEITAGNPEKIYHEILAVPLQPAQPVQDLLVRQRLQRDEYISIINRLRQHILRGDCYEINYCQEFFAEQAKIDPVHIYTRLSRLSPNPFSALYRLGEKWLICASPERFIKKQGGRILSQPIKGTSKRDVSGKADEQDRQALYHSAKDRAENVMVVDLVRNDLSRICEEGTVAVDELYGVYSFPQVHQMISTVSGQLKKGISFPEVVQAMFPMGSMTGAPKRRVMELIEQYEKTKRGIFSGAIGYLSPDGNFDFNVVIRSILYNEQNAYLSFLAGSGITFYSDAALEWDECLLKAAAIREALKN